MISKFLVSDIPKILIPAKRCISLQQNLRSFSCLANSKCSNLCKSLLGIDVKQNNDGIGCLVPLRSYGTMYEYSPYQEFKLMLQVKNYMPDHIQVQASNDGVRITGWSKGFDANVDGIRDLFFEKFYEFQHDVDVSRMEAEYSRKYAYLTVRAPYRQSRINNDHVVRVHIKVVEE